MKALFSFFFLTLPFLAHAVVLTNFKVEGNERIETETIRAYAKFKSGENYTELDLDEILKELLRTDLFSDVEVRALGKTLLIKVQENPLVRHIVIEGNSDLDDEVIEKEMQLKPRRVFRLATLKADTQKIKDIYRVKGYYGAEVTPKVIRRDQNRVDVILDVKEGVEAKVKKISFIGNKTFDSSELESIIQTKESRWYRFFSTDDTYDPDRASLDQEKLRQFYLDRGYVDFQIRSALAELSPDKRHFYLTYTLSEGQRYKVGSLELTSDIEEIDVQTLRNDITFKEGDGYSAGEVERSVRNLIATLGDMGYAFTDINPSVEKDKDQEGIVNIHLNIVKGPRVYIRNIRIKGNHRTNEEVIRRESRLNEGDAYHVSLIKDSERRIKNLGYFKKVTLSQIPTENTDQVDILVDLEEEPRTGELSFAGGFGSGEGLIFEVGMRENNLFGKGQHLDSKFRIGKKSQDFNVAFTEPYFMGYNTSATFAVFRTRRKDLYESNETDTATGARVSFAYELYENLIQQVGYSYSREKLSGVKNSARRSIFLRQQDGRHTLSTVTHSLTWDKLDSRVNTKRGYSLTMTNRYTGLGGSVKFHSHTFGAEYFTPVWSEEVILNLSAEYGFMNGIGQKVRPTDRFQLGGETLRGFDYNGIGPRDTSTNDALKGKRYYRGTAEVFFPLGLPEELGIKGSVFTDVGSLWNSGERGAIVDENRGLRAGAGFGISWRSPFGPIKISIAKPYLKKRRDEKRLFIFGFSSRF